MGRADPRGRALGEHRHLPARAGRQRLAGMSRTGINAAQLLHAAINTGPLPDEHGAAALWWRISRHLQPTIAASTDHDDSITTPWAEQLTKLVAPIGPNSFSTVACGRPWSRWSTMPCNAAGHSSSSSPPPRSQPVDDECQTLVWRISLLTDAAPDEDRRRTRRPPIRASTSNRTRATGGEQIHRHRPADGSADVDRPALTVATVSGRARGSFG